MILGRLLGEHLFLHLQKGDISNFCTDSAMEIQLYHVYVPGMINSQQGGIYDYCSYRTAKGHLLKPCSTSHDLSSHHFLLLEFFYCFSQLKGCFLFSSPRSNPYCFLLRCEVITSSGCSASCLPCYLGRP